MSCPHATTTTLLWLYGEADEAHAEHVASCAACQAVAREHADVMSAMSGLSHLDLQSSVSATARPANHSWPAGLGLSAALAAAVALTMFTTYDPAPEVVASSEPVDLSVFAALEDDPLDDRFDALALELGDLAANVEGETL